MFQSTDVLFIKLTKTVYLLLDPLFNILSIKLSGYAIFCFGEVQLVENDKLRNGNREALTALRKKARTTTTSVPSPFGSIMKGVSGTGSRPLVQEVCTTCGNHDSFEQTWTMFPGTDLFVGIPFHAAHTILETGLLFYSALGIF